jgi:hypothetical protein
MRYGSHPGMLGSTRMCGSLNSPSPITIRVLAGGFGAVGELVPRLIGVPAHKQGIDFPNPDYVALAHAYGGVMSLVESKASFTLPLCASLMAPKWKAPSPHRN